MTLDQELARLTAWTAEHLMLMPVGEFARPDWLANARLHDSWVRRGLIEPVGRHDGRAWLYRIGQRGGERRDRRRRDAGAWVLGAGGVSGAAKIAPGGYLARRRAAAGLQPYAELFARETRPGWECAGNETTKFNGQEDLAA